MVISVKVVMNMLITVQVLTFNYMNIILYSFGAKPLPISAMIYFKIEE